MTEPTERDREMVSRHMRAFLDWATTNSPNDAIAKNARRAAESMCAAAREEGRQEERERCAKIAEATEDSPPYEVGQIRHLIAQRIREGKGDAE